MPNKPRDILPNNLYHIYNRAVEKRRIFYSEKDYNKFLERIFYYKSILGVKILSYSILPNHFHFLLEEPEFPTFEVPHLESGEKIKTSAISKFMSDLANSYTKYFNYNKGHSGRIFQGPFQSKLIHNDAYLQSIIVYINLNPLKHGVIKNINDWIYTSHQELLNEIEIKLINHNDFFDPADYKNIIKDNINKIKNMDLEFD